MQYCKRCNVTILNPQKKCPLCQGSLEGEAREQDRLFPNLSQKASRFALGVRIFTFVCIAAIVISVMLNWAGGFHTFWSRYVLAGVGCMWVLTMVAVAKRRNLMKIFIWQMCMLWCVFLLWDQMTGWHGWAVDYALPAIWFAATAGILAMIAITRTPAAYYMVYLLLSAAGSLLPLCLLIGKVVTNRIPSILCVMCGVLLFCGMLLFRGRNTMEELKKKIHL